jgi:hypothetical protein
MVTRLNNTILAAATCSCRQDPKKPIFSIDANSSVLKTVQVYPGKPPSTTDIHRCDLGTLIVVGRATSCSQAIIMLEVQLVKESDNNSAVCKKEKIEVEALRVTYGCIYTHFISLYLFWISSVYIARHKRRLQHCKYFIVYPQTFHSFVCLQKYLMFSHSLPRATEAFLFHV